MNPCRDRAGQGLGMDLGEGHSFPTQCLLRILSVVIPLQGGLQTGMAQVQQVDKKL